MRGALAAGCALLAVACVHSTQTGKNPEVKDATAPQPPEAAARARKVTPKTPPGHPPLAASPSELMQPGSQEKIARALKSKGVVDRDDVRGEQLTAAVRKFQESQGLAATGFPDHETLLRLGIDPKEVDKSLENFSGTAPNEAQADVSKRSDDAGKGGSGEQTSKKGATPHKGAPAKNSEPPSDSD
jgi:peptidoglycan hydrolase-like protein with peptidoglycan-binding domain